MSRLFEFRLELSSANTAVEPKDLIGQGISVGILSGEGSAYRYFHGIVRRLVVGGILGSTRSYVVVLVPGLWKLTRSADCRIFQNLTVVEILEKLFQEYSLADYELKLTVTYPKREYCVQYRETAFDFVSRLMEFEGIFYYFKHEQGKHTLIVADQASSYVSCAEASVVHVPIVAREQPSDRIMTWQHTYEFRSGRFSLTDYDFAKPANQLFASSATSVQLTALAPFEVFDYPGSYADTSRGVGLSKNRVEADEAAYEVVLGTSTYRTFTPGGKFTIAKHADAEELNKSYVIRDIEHRASGSDHYRNDFAAIPATVAYRPPLATPRPSIVGSQTAVVVGSKGEEIWPDKYGRIKVQFHWDRLGKLDENSSCWIRCAQSSAGKSWGSLALPRVGQEVVVSFLDGDPDRPLVTGVVYNAADMPAYSLPDNKTRSYFKTRSSKAGEAEDSNEIRFEDLKDSEEFYVHAQKDAKRVVGNNDSLTVGSDKADDGSQTILIYKDRTEMVKTGNETVTIEKGDRVVTVKAGDETLEVTAGDLATKIKAGSGTIEAGTKITLKVGKNSLEISQQGVTINGIQVSIKGTGLVEAKGPTIEIAADAMLTLKGGIVNIN